MSTTATVYLVGAGPGDPGLITLKGLECLRRADLVLYDGLVNPLLLRHTDAVCERTARTVTAGGRKVAQDEVNARIVAAAKEGKTVVRLKGGDPYIFGRGGEEAAALAKAGVPFEVVPGITAATAAGACAGISLTHRQLASQVVFVTGHEDPTKADPSIDYQLLADMRATLVFYMGLHRLDTIADALISNGKPGETRCCVISRATTPEQRTVEATLADVAGKVVEAGLQAPSLFVVGEVVSQRDTISWFEQLPLFGLRIGITRPDHQADSAVARCLQLGAEPVVMPLIEIRPPEDYAEIDAVMDRLGEFDWLIFTSVNGVRSLLQRLWENGGDTRRLAKARIACIGPATAASLNDFSLRADLVPESYRSEELAEALRPHVAGRRVLWPRASRGRDVLPDVLTAVGASFEQVVCYQNVDVESLPPNVVERIESGELDWIALSSPSIARSLATLLGESAKQRLGDSTRIVSISPVTTAAANDAGLPVNAEAVDYTWDGIFDAIVAAHQTAKSVTVQPFEPSEKSWQKD